MVGLVNGSLHVDGAGYLSPRRSRHLLHLFVPSKSQHITITETQKWKPGSASPGRRRRFALATSHRFLYKLKDVQQVEGVMFRTLIVTGFLTQVRAPSALQL
jgi:hypothetical protein